ncbi:hypothetical protein BT96DRAFT_322989 [Gymnopus androsaceus JB14]|uniref:Exonuclease domain-containing protein n=1 Tax=Gymnopus androsaceus JB14 TaxID=1447944 RepID=A0A6A4GYH0_9AGAR|nr:hypothetical protein BT96DRAFT_322989 [Gymnopus androsaceus JB14]
MIDYDTQGIVYDHPVKSGKPVTDYLTQWSGITAETLTTATTTLTEAQADILRLLTWLTKKWCRWGIQVRGEGGHDPEEDARAAMELVQGKFRVLRDGLLLRRQRSSKRRCYDDDDCRGSRQDSRDREQGTVSSSSYWWDRDEQGGTNRRDCISGYGYGEEERERECRRDQERYNSSPTKRQIRRVQGCYKAPHD